MNRDSASCGTTSNGLPPILLKYQKIGKWHMQGKDKLEEILSEYFQNLMKDINLQYQEGWLGLNKKRLKTTHVVWMTVTIAWESWETEDSETASSKL